MSQTFTHLDQNGNAVMVDVSGKARTCRTAEAAGEIKVNTEIIRQIKNIDNKKGDVIATARIAGIMAAKNTSALIPLCHPLMLSKCSIDITVDEQQELIRAVSKVKIEGKTGVEMEALTAVSVSLLTIYDMCKAVDKGMVISGIRLLEKTGGKSGDYHRNDQEEADEG